MKKQKNSQKPIIEQHQQRLQKNDKEEEEEEQEAQRYYRERILREAFEIWVLVLTKHIERKELCGRRIELCKEKKASRMKRRILRSWNLVVHLSQTEVEEDLKTQKRIKTEQALLERLSGLPPKIQKPPQPKPQKGRVKSGAIVLEPHSQVENSTNKKVLTFGERRRKEEGEAAAIREAERNIRIAISEYRQLISKQKETVDKQLEMIMKRETKRRNEIDFKFSQIADWQRKQTRLKLTFTSFKAVKRLNREMWEKAAIQYIFHHIGRNSLIAFANNVQQKEESKLKIALKFNSVSLIGKVFQTIGRLLELKHKRISEFRKRQTKIFAKISIGKWKAITLEHRAIREIQSAERDNAGNQTYKIRLQRKCFKTWWNYHLNEQISREREATKRKLLDKAFSLLHEIDKNSTKP